MTAPRNRGGNQGSPSVLLCYCAVILHFENGCTMEHLVRSISNTLIWCRLEFSRFFTEFSSYFSFRLVHLFAILNFLAFFTVCKSCESSGIKRRFSNKTRPANWRTRRRARSLRWSRTSSRGRRDSSACVMSEQGMTRVFTSRTIPRTNPSLVAENSSTSRSIVERPEMYAASVPPAHNSAPKGKEIMNKSSRKVRQAY